MTQCPQCNFANIRNRFYCEQCGTLLPSSTSQHVKTSTSRSQEYSSSTSPLTPPPSPISIPSFISSEEDFALPPSRTQDTLYTTSRIILYLLGAVIAAFGLYALLTAFTTSAIISFFSLFTGSIILLVIVFSLHRTPLLNWWQRLFGELATTGGAFVLLLIGAIIVGLQPAENMDKVANIVYGCIILLYGIVVAIVALW